MGIQARAIWLNPECTPNTRALNQGSELEHAAGPGTLEIRAFASLVTEGNQLSQDFLEAKPVPQSRRLSCHAQFSER